MACRSLCRVFCGSQAPKRATTSISGSSILSSASGSQDCVGGSSGVNNVNKDDYNNRSDDNDDYDVDGVHDELDDISGCSMIEYSADEYPLNC